MKRKTKRIRRQANLPISRMRMTGIAAAALAVLTCASVWAGCNLPPINNERDLPAAALAKPVVIYNRTYTGAIYADYVPDAGEARSPFVTPMARNEYEPVQVGLYVPSGKETLRNVTLEVKCPLPCKVGHIYYMPREELSWLTDMDKSPGTSTAATWPCDSKLLVGKRSSLPLYVLPLPRISEIRSGRSAAFWVTFKTEGSVPAGTHKGAFTLSAEGKTLETVPFVVQVYPFSLPRPKVHYGMYHMPYQTPAPFQTREFMKLYLADMAAHGMNRMDVDVPVSLLAKEGYGPGSSSLLGPPELPKIWGSRTTRLYIDNFLAPEDYQPDGGYNALKVIDNQIKMGREAGLIQHDHPCQGFTDTYNIARKEAALANMRGYAGAQSWPDFTMYMYDEPPPQAFAEVEQNLGAWRRLGATTTAALGSQLAAFGVGHAHSAWIQHAGTITPELQREADRLGAEVWSYDCFLRTTNVEAGRFNSGLYTWSLGLKGNTPEGYMGEVNHQPYFDANWKLSGPSILGYVVPSPTGPVPGVAWEGRREGVDDVRYLQLLEARVKAASAKNPPARYARQWLQSLRKRSETTEFQSYRYNVWGADFLDPNSRISPGDYDAIRAQAAALIMKLPAAPGELNPEPAKWVRVRARPVQADAFAKASIAECLEALKAGTVKQKRQAAGALAIRKADEILPARDLLIGLLENPEVRMVALRALANLGPKAAPAIPALRKLLGEKDSFVRTGATYVLTRIGGDAAEALSPCINDPNITIVNLAREALDKLKKQ
ncbi:MAG: HEAT repeat domain-containing protein [Armatimonadetes bacterium]|nr:HEAT repeat domain-containing protein [Armatimonadota bacterium]